MYKEVSNTSLKLENLRIACYCLKSMIIS